MVASVRLGHKTVGKSTSVLWPNDRTDSIFQQFISKRLEICQDNFLSFGNSLALEINKKRNVKYGELALNRINGGFPRYVLNQLKIFVPVGKDIKIVTPEK